MYGFIIAAEKPGCFYLVFKHPLNRTRSEIVTVHPDGFLFRSRKFRDVDSLLRFFKQDEASKQTAPAPINQRPPEHRSRPPPSTSRRAPSSAPNGGIHPSRAAMVGDIHPSRAAMVGGIHPSRAAMVKTDTEAPSWGNDAPIQESKPDISEGGW